MVFHTPPWQLCRFGLVVAAEGRFFQYHVFSEGTVRPPPSNTRVTWRGKFNFAKYFQEKNPEPLVFAPFSKGIQEMDGGGENREIKPTKKQTPVI